MNEHEAVLALNAIAGLGHLKIKKLIEHFGSAQRLFALKASDLLASLIVSAEAAQNIISFPKDEFLKEEIGFSKSAGIEAITLWDEKYPQSLKEIHDAPVVLYVKGKLPEDNGLAIAMVGSRQASLYGTATAHQFAVRLVELGITVVSGMARGIDTAAHQGAIKARGQTIAVLGCGLAHVYPQENEALMKEISQNGAVVSEFPIHTPPFAYNFPRRNRIISGLSLGVIVVEAREKSGALITADCALEQGREVYAIPGKIDNPSARGVNNLIKQGAKLITSVDDILEDLETHLTTALHKEEKNLAITDQENKGKVEAVNRLPDTGPKLSQDEQVIYKQLSDRPIHIDELIKQNTAALSILFQLELKRLIKQLPGKMFIRAKKHG